MAFMQILTSLLLCILFFTPNEGWYPCGAKGCGEYIIPSGSLLKAVLANGAQSLDGVQVAGTGTVISDQPLSQYDNTQGFGAVDLLSSLPLKNETDFNIYVKNDVPLGRGGVHLIDVDIEFHCNTDLSVTVAWYDPPAANGCVKCLVNDVDLQVKHTSSSKLYHPNGREFPDDTNNLERVRVRDTTIGESYTISVTAKSLGEVYTYMSNYILCKVRDLRLFNKSRCILISFIESSLLGPT